MNGQKYNIQNPRRHDKVSFGILISSVASEAAKNSVAAKHLTGY